MRKTERGAVTGETKIIRWMPEEYKRQDGYTSVVSRMIAQLGLEENEELAWGDKCSKTEVQEVELERRGSDNKRWWET